MQPVPALQRQQTMTAGKFGFDRFVSVGHVVVRRLASRNEDVARFLMAVDVGYLLVFSSSVLRINSISAAVFGIRSCNDALSIENV
jgi:hypothetical protein